MKLVDIFETTEDEQQTQYAVDTIMEQCHPFVKNNLIVATTFNTNAPIPSRLEGSTKGMIFRGIASMNPHERFVRKDTRKDRKPRDMPFSIHTFLDSWFEEKFGFKYRSNSTFATPKPTVADLYGTPSVIFPAGQYKLLYDERITDLWLYLKESGLTGLMHDAKMVDELSDSQKKKIASVLNNTHFHERLDVPRSSTKSVEIMIKCDYYYAVNIEDLKNENGIIMNIAKRQRGLKDAEFFKNFSK